MGRRRRRRRRRRRDAPTRFPKQPPTDSIFDTIDASLSCRFEIFQTDDFFIMLLCHNIMHTISLLTQKIFCD